MATETQVKLVRLEMLEALRSATGARWGPGERAAFPPEVADDLIKRGIARPAPPRPAKAPDGPEADKMIARDAARRK